MISQLQIRSLIQWKEDPCDLIPVVLKDSGGNFRLCFKPTRYSTETYSHPVVIPFNKLLSYIPEVALEFHPYRATYAALYKRAYRKKALLSDINGDLYIRVNSISYRPSIFKTLMQTYKSELSQEFSHESAIENLFGFINPVVLEQLYPGSKTYARLLQEPFIAVKYDQLLITEQPCNLLGIELNDDDISTLYDNAYVNANVLSLLTECKLSSAKVFVSRVEDYILYTSDSILSDENRRFKKYVKLSKFISYTEFRDRFYSMYENHLIPNSLFYQDELFLKEPIARAIRQTLKEKLKLYLQLEITTQAVVA